MQYALDTVTTVAQPSRMHTSRVYIYREEKDTQSNGTGIHDDLKS